MNLQKDIIDFKRYKIKRQKINHLLSWYYTAVAKGLVKPIDSRAVEISVRKLKGLAA